jgi:hypothetical protein
MASLNANDIENIILVIQTCDTVKWNIENEEMFNQRLEMIIKEYHLKFCP